MQLPLPFGVRPAHPREALLVAGRKTYLVEFVRVRRARHYILRVRDDGRLRVTVPWGGSRAEAERFVRERAGWIERERYRQLRAALRTGPWQHGTTILLDGEPVALTVSSEAGGRVTVGCGDGGFALPATAAATDLRPHVERHLRAMAARSLPQRLADLAAAHGYRFSAVTVRSQRTRWGACSPGGRISLNWRLVQAPPSVRDYVLLHELVHLRHLDHSPRFWKELARICPRLVEARAWLRANRDLKA